MISHTVEIVDGLWLAPSGFTALQIALMAIGGLACLGILVAAGRGNDSGMVFSSVVLLACLSTLMLTLGIGVSQKSKAVREAQTQYLATFGVEVPDAHWDDLELPNTEPESDAKFGVAQAIVDGKIVSIRTEWSGGELKVYSTEGVELEPIEPKE